MTMVKEERMAKWEDAKFPPWKVINYWLQIKSISQLLGSCTTKV
jgi:hypothetical protein